MAGFRALDSGGIAAREPHGLPSQIRRSTVVTMQIHLLKSKIHRAQVTASSLDYEGSLTIAADLMEKVGLMPYERVL